MRIFAAVGATLGWFALALQLYLMAVQSPDGIAAKLATVILFLSFFTILTNLLVSLIWTTVAWSPARGGWKWLSGPSVQAAAAGYIAIVGIVYQLLLRRLWNPQGAQWVADVLLHSILPLSYVLYWVLFGPRGGLRWKDPVAWLSYPALYLVYVLVRGALSGLYPYPFVDVNVLGYGGVMLRAAVFLLVFLGMGLLVVVAGHRIQSRAPDELDGR